MHSRSLPVLQKQSSLGMSNEVPTEIEKKRSLQPRNDSREANHSFASKTRILRFATQLPRTISRLAALPKTVSKARKGALVLPRVLTHTVTFGCNAKCVMCDSWQLPTADDLKLNEIENIYESLPTMDAVRLTGGEPFVRKDFSDIYHLALQHLRPLFMHVSSNGFLSDRIVQFCENRDRSIPLELAISLDGVGDYHNRIRCNTNAWKTAWATLNRLAPLRKKLNLTLVVNQTIVDNEGLEHYESLHRQLRLHNIEHHVVIAYAESATYSLDRDRRVDLKQAHNNQSDLDQAGLFRLLDRAEERANSLPLHRRTLRKYYLRGMRDRLAGASSTSNPPCQALHSHLRMFPNGDVPVCQFNSKTVGNLRDQSFAQVWLSKPSNEEREWVRACSGCWAECEVVPSAVYSLDFIKPVRSKPQSQSQHTGV